MSEVTILHLSDLHMEDTKLYDIDIILDALFKDLEELGKNNIKPDLVFFTGDFVKSGKNKKEFTLVRDKFVNPLLEKLRLKEDCFFFTIGNHDIDRDKWQPHEANGIRDTYKTFTKLNDFMISLKLQTDRKYLNRSGNYIKFRGSFDYKNIKSETNKLFAVYKTEIKGIKFGIACLNSAWLAFGGREDKEKLLVSEYQIGSVIKKLDGCDIKIALMHHPLDWLVECDREAISNRLPKEFALLFTGHLHQTKPSMIQTPIGSFFHSEGGALFNEDRTFYHGYSILRLSDSNITEVCFRKYFNEGARFDADTSITPGGCRSWQLEKKKLP
ncbi:MAG: metallophosphoesterase [Nitrospirae bacterium]|nr:metallophosphoesterase [Nitrospirota bacterium]MBF0591226.1 metallophosphoesterase [Nitrospirota bacterium]